MNLLRSSLFIVVLGALLAYFGVPYAGIVVWIGVVVFLLWLFNITITRGQT